MTSQVKALYGKAILDQSSKVVFDFGSTVPSDGTIGFAKGCIFVQTDGANEAALLYINVGSTTSANFDAVDVNIAEMALLSGLTSTAALIDAVVSGTSVTGHAAGAIGTGVAPSTKRFTRNGTIITEIKVDLEGLASVATANDVIGLAAGGVAYIGQNVVASNGIIYAIELICLETPAGGDNDVNVVVNSSASLAYDGAGGTTYGVNGGDAVAGQVVQNLVQGLTANHYFYLTAGTGDTAATYTGGMFLIRLHGHPVLS